MKDYRITMRVYTLEEFTYCVTASNQELAFLKALYNIARYGYLDDDVTSVKIKIMSF